MELKLIGLNHHTADLSVREKITFDPRAVLAALKDLRPDCHEGVLLSTCNRTEFYYVPNSEDDMAIMSFFQRQTGIDLEVERDCFFTLDDLDVVRHLFRVASGADSLIFGENEILGQVRRSLEFANQYNMAGMVLSRLFQMALAVGKKVRTCTDIGKISQSIGSSAVALAEHALAKDLRKSTVLVIGTGVVGYSVARTLQQKQVGALRISNHQSARTLEFSDRFSALPIPWPIPISVIAKADLIITSTAARQVILSAKTVKEAVKKGYNDSLVVIDLAVPRDVDQDVERISNVTLYNLDDIKITLTNADGGEGQIRNSVDDLVADQVRVFREWLQERDIVSTIRQLRSNAESVRVSELKWASTKISTMTDRDREILEMLTSRLINKLFHIPSERLRMAATNGHIEDYRKVVEDLFGLNQDEDSTPNWH